MEANPNDDRIRVSQYTENSEDARDWRWFFERV
jgi:hypothetical protein